MARISYIYYGASKCIEIQCNSLLFALIRMDINFRIFVIPDKNCFLAGFLGNFVGKIRLLPVYHAVGGSNHKKH